MREKNYNKDYKVKRTPLVLNDDAPVFKRVTGIDEYWGEQSPLTETMHELFAEKVPGSGEADTIHGELIRAINRIYYRAFNDGIHGLVYINEDEDEDGDEGYYDYDDEEPNYFDEYYGKMFFFLEQFLPTEHFEAIRRVRFLALEGLELHGTGLLDDLADRVIHTVQNTEDGKWSKEELDYY